MEFALEDYQSRFSKLKNDYLQKLPSKLEALEEYWQLITDNCEIETHANEFYLIIHKLAGSASTFGFEKVGTAASQLLSILVNKPSYGDDSVKNHIEQILSELKEQICLAIAQDSKIKTK